MGGGDNRHYTPAPSGPNIPPLHQQDHHADAQATPTQAGPQRPENLYDNVPASSPTGETYQDEVERTEFEEEETPIHIEFKAGNSVAFRNGSQALTTIRNEQHQIIKSLFTQVRELQTAPRHSPPPPTFHNNPALLQKVATNTTKVAGLEKASLLITLKSTSPPPPPSTAKATGSTTTHPAPLQHLCQGSLQKGPQILQIRHPHHHHCCCPSQTRQYPHHHQR